MKGIIKMGFWGKVDIKGPTECWLWKAGLSRPGGYGRYTKNSQTTMAHRVAFEFFYGREPEGQVLHKCGNKGCVNPGHLYEGDGVDNARDLLVSGGGGRRKLSNEAVREVRRLGETGQYLYRDLAEKFGCSISTIGCILIGQTHIHI